MLAIFWLLCNLLGQCVFTEKIRHFKDVNLANKKKTSQSSTFRSSGSNFAVDGRFDSSSSSCTEGKKGTEADWWEVDLVSHFNIGQVRIFNDKHCCREPLSDFRIEVVNGRKFREKSKKICDERQGAVSNGWLNVPCKEPIVGRIVRITKQTFAKGGSLCLCEVEIFEAADPELKLNILKRRHLNKRLWSKELMMFKVDSLVQCAVKCSTTWCYSFNFKRPSAGASFCEVIPYHGTKSSNRTGYNNFLMK